eukprot:TRINITY_DN476_c0_g1_i2.p1 TRINITY_DN476_c0_g1~~TRINITY_DN476_c0_g1_i2.p1  ORF type:complete len:290 (-),score=23.59 TRINITY_DN476_c0_g1_i2:270-1139(-)
MAVEAINSAYQALDNVLAPAVQWGLNATFGVRLTSAAPTKGLPCVDSPVPVFVGSSIYLVCVLAGLYRIKSLDLKPRIKEPFLLQTLVFLHNSFCFLLSLYMCVGIIYEAIRTKYSIWGNAYNPKQVPMARLIYLFYMSKYFEFLDTIIMVLKRNARQITVLHVYHHYSISLIWWVISHHAPGGDAYFSAALNSGVHVFMYFYYLVSALLRNNEKARRKYLFWGRYLTQLQMTQFMVNMVQAWYDLRSRAQYPRFLFQYQGDKEDPTKEGRMRTPGSNDVAHESITKFC